MHSGACQKGCYNGLILKEYEEYPQWRTHHKHTKPKLWQQSSSNKDYVSGPTSTMGMSRYNSQQNIKYMAKYLTWYLKSRDYLKIRSSKQKTNCTSGLAEKNCEKWV